VDCARARIYRIDKAAKAVTPPGYDRLKIDRRRQIFDVSCIPGSVGMVLKPINLEKAVEQQSSGLSSTGARVESALFERDCGERIRHSLGDLTFRAVSRGGKPVAQDLKAHWTASEFPAKCAGNPRRKS
jgi:hypothetical protein